MPPPTFLQRLKERKLVQWALAYLAGAWVLYEAVDTVGDRWGLPDVFFQGLAVVLAIGFFITLVLAWYHGEKGRQRVSGPELLMVAALLVVAGVALTVLTGRGVEPTATEEPSYVTVDDTRPSIAVLPFQNRSGVEDDLYFTDGLQDQIITQLTKIGGLSVRGLTSVLVYRDSPKNLREIGAELNARYIMEGGVQRAGETVRINVQLIEAATDEHIWASVFDRTMSVENLFSIQTEIVEAVTDSLRAVVTPEEQARLEESPTHNSEAYDAFLWGRFYLRQMGEENTRRAIQFFERALDSDSLFAPAFAGLGEAYAWLGMGNIEAPDQTWPYAERAAVRALELDESMPTAHTVLGLERMLLQHDWQAAEERFRRSLDLNPDRADTRLYYSLLLSVLRRDQEALAHAAAAKELDPNSVWVDAMRCWVFQFHGRFDEALAIAEGMLESEPPIPLGNLLLAQTFIQRERFEDALAPLQAWMIAQGEDVNDEVAWTAMLNGLLDREEEARQEADRLERLAEEGRWVSPVTRAWASIGLGDYDRAMDFLEEGRERRDFWIAFVVGLGYVTPGVTDNPRFQDLRRRMGLD